MTDSGLDPSAALKVKRVLEGFSLIPLAMTAASRGLSVKSFISDVTGLSKARVSSADFSNLRASTQRRIDARIESRIRSQVDGVGAAENFIESMKSFPRLTSGGYAPHAGLMRAFELAAGDSLPLSMGVSLAVDELIDSLIKCCDAGDFDGFKESLDMYLTQMCQLSEEPRSDSFDEWFRWQITGLTSMGDWVSADKYIRKLLEALYLEIIGTLDAEWGRLYFVGIRRPPVFALLMIDVFIGADGKERVGYEGGGKQPSRILLEFFYSLIFRMRYKSWPSKPPGRKDLADILSSPGASEVMSPADIGNYFDATKNLTVDLIEEHWYQMFHHFFPERTEGKRVRLPIPIVVFALYWQRAIRTGARMNRSSILRWNLSYYLDVWDRKMKCLALVVGAHHEHSVAADAPFEWPEWLLSQSGLTVHDLR